MMFRKVAATLFVAMTIVPVAHARAWESLGSGWHVDTKDVKVELKDGVVNTENTVVFQMLQDASGKKPAVSAEPTAQLYLMCESRQYRLWDVQSATQMGPISTAMFDAAQTLEVYCDKIGKLPDEKKLRPGQR